MTWLRPARVLITRLFGSPLDARPTAREKRIALVIAGLSDLTQLALAPLFAAGALSPLDDALDFIVAGLLFFTLGRHWRIALALALELLPGMALFPSWTAMVATFQAAPEPVESAESLVLS